MAGNIHHQISHLNHLAWLFRGLPPTKQTPHPKHQFPRAERLGHIIIRSQLQPEYTINLAVICAMFFLIGPGAYSLDALLL